MRKKHLSKGNRKKRRTDAQELALQKMHSVNRSRRAKITQNNNTDDIYLVAKKHGWQYSGDMSLEHGGLFYRPETWDSDGYAEAIEVQIACDTLYVTVGYINKSGDCTDDILRREYAMEPTTELEIDWTRHMWGVEPDCNGNLSFPLIDTDNGDFFIVDDYKPISIDHLQGWFVSKFLTT